MKKIYIGPALVLSILLLKPENVQANEAPIIDGQVEISALLNHFDGESKITKDENNNYYAEIIFDGHILQMYENEAILWLDGEPVPYDFKEVEGVYIPIATVPDHLFTSPSLSANFFQYFMGYEIENNTLVFDDKQEEDEINTDINIDDIEGDVEYEESKVPESETNEDIKDETKKPSNQKPSNNKPSDDKETTQEDEVVEPKELGYAQKEIDMAYFGIHQSEKDGFILDTKGEKFSIYFNQENNLQVNWIGKNKSKSLSVKDGQFHVLHFPNAEEDFYTIELIIEDSRKNGLTLEHVQNYIQTIHSDILINGNESNVNISFINKDEKTVNEVQKQIERYLLYLGVQQFQKDKEIDEENNSVNLNVQFNLYDSTWGA